MGRQDVPGTVYLLHFVDPITGTHLAYQHARHYLGWAEDLDARLAAHHAGSGANLIRVICQAGLDFKLVRTWEGTRHLERQLKRRGGLTRICPTCILGGYAERDPAKRIVAPSIIPTLPSGLIVPELATTDPPF